MFIHDIIVGENYASRRSKYGIGRKSEKNKETYLPGMRIKLIRMDDVQAPPFGTEGTVRGVDDIRSIMVAWDNGSRLNIIPEEDEIEIVSYD